MADLYPNFRPVSLERSKANDRSQRISLMSDSSSNISARNFGKNQAARMEQTAMVVQPRQSETESEIGSQAGESDL